MEQRRLGSSGIEVGAVALGTMMFGAWGNPDRAECRRMVDMALDAGVTLVDTADIYDFGVSEEILGEALAGRRDRVVLATKFGNPMDDDPLHRGGSRRWVRESVTNSLRRLQTDRIDLYQMHRPDPDVPFEETLGALHELVEEGLVRAVGTSCFPAEQLVESQWIARAARVRAAGDRAAAVLGVLPRRGAGGVPDVPQVRRERRRVGAAERRLAHRQVPPRPAAAARLACRARARPLRPLPATGAR